LEFDDVERWRGFFKQELEAAVKAAEEVGERLPVEDRLPYMLGWVNSDVAISGGLLEMAPPTCGSWRRLMPCSTGLRHSVWRELDS
jgi:hypothetical protein